MIYKGKLHLSLAGLGMFGAMLIMIVIFFILFGLQRNYGMKISISLPLGFVLFYISLFALTPNIMTNIQNIFPLAKLIMAILFAVSLYRLIIAFFRHSKPNLKTVGKELEKTPIHPEDEPEINHELKDDKKEGKLLKKKTIKLTKLEIHTLDDIEKYLSHLMNLIKQKDKNITQEETHEISRILQHISDKENILLKSMPLLKRQAEIFKSKHRKDISELEKRYRTSNGNPKQQKLIHEELTYQKRMIEVLNFIETYENKIVEFTQNLNQTLSRAMLKLKSLYPHECLGYLNYAHKQIVSMKHIFKKQKELEKYVLSLNKKTMKDLKKEKKAT